MNDLNSLSLVTLAQMICDREITSEEVVRAYIERINAVNPLLNAIVYLTADAALERARAADAALARGDVWGPLHGVPMSLKDCWSTQGVVTTSGTTGLADYVPDKDATVVARLKAAGAILLGKTNTSEITLRYLTDNYVYGRTNNPYNLEHSPGGSSGGAAAIIAVGGSPFDVGSDLGGSVRFPAHCCGISGLKPSFGRLPRSGHIPGVELIVADGMVQPGPLARYVEDLELLLGIMAGPDQIDPSVIPMPLGRSQDVTLSELRFGYFTAIDQVTAQAETLQVIDDVLEVLRGTRASVQVYQPAGTDAQTSTLWSRLMTADGGLAVRQLLQQFGTQTMHPNIRWTQESAAISVEAFHALLLEWTRLKSAALPTFEQVDVLICPVAPGPALLHDVPPQGDFMRYFNLLGWPVAVLRAGTSAEGLPIGVQIAAAPWREDIVLAVARHLEAEFGGWQPPSILQDL